MAPATQEEEAAAAVAEEASSSRLLPLRRISVSSSSRDVGSLAMMPVATGTGRDDLSKRI